MYIPPHVALIFGPLIRPVVLPVIRPALSVLRRVFWPDSPARSARGGAARTAHAVALGPALLLWLLLSTSGTAAPLYLAPPLPEGTAPAAVPDGSPDAPFTSLSEALKALAAQNADRILLKPGFYGNTHWRNLKPKRVIRIESEVTGKAHFDSLRLSNSQNLHMVGFSVWPRSKDTRRGVLVKAEANSTGLIFEEFDLRGNADADTRYLTWTKEDWATLWRTNGFRLNGPHAQVIKSRITGVEFGITTTGPHAVVAGNLVQGFSGDGLRGLGNNSRFTGNVVTNCIKTGQNHDDAFQSWAPRNQGPESAVSDLTVENNVFWEWTAGPGHPLRCRLQGIALFDGFFKNVSIRNNLIVVNTYHGISIYGGIDSVIANNTVVHPSGTAQDFPWINVHNHKNGGLSRNVQVYNNVAMSYKNLPDALKRNVVARFPGKLFQDPTRGDFRPRAGGPLDNADLGASIVEKIIAAKPQN